MAYDPTELSRLAVWLEGRGNVDEAATCREALKELALLSVRVASMEKMLSGVAMYETEKATAAAADQKPTQ